MKKKNLAFIMMMAVVLTGVVLASNMVKADDDSVVDEIDITVPVACTLGGTGMDTHNATINNGQYNSAVGETTMKAFCNDNNGFSIYAIGYTDNTDGKNVLTNTTLGDTYDIETGTLTTGADSQWAMKLSTITSPAPTYPIIIVGSTADTDKEQGDPDYTSFQEVPDDYTKVAYKKAGTDIGTGAEGATLKSTYQAYISPTQPAGTYTGQVKYTMVHPYNAAKPVLPSRVGVTYHANGSTFSGGTTTNRVVYTSSPMYIATTPLIAKSANVGDNGIQNGSYATGNTLTPVTATGASKMKVVIHYGFSSNTMLLVIEGNYDGQGVPEHYEMIEGPATDTATYTFDGDAATFYMKVYDAPTSANGQDYGYYAEVYPIYMTEQTDTEPSVEFETMSADVGTYIQTTDWYGSWYADINNQHYDFMNETEVVEYLNDNVETLDDTNIDLYRGLTFAEAYTRANKTQDGGYYKQQDLNNSMCQTVAITQNQTMKDVRDDNTYMIGKLKDGRCWMLENLALDPTDSTTAANLNADNTNATDEAVTNYLNGGSSNYGWSNVAVTNVVSGFVSYTEPMINNVSKDTLVTSYGPASTNGEAKVGVYYNYCAATVGTYCYANHGGIDLPDTIIDASQDICPSNWRMPTDGNASEYYALAEKYGNVAASDDSFQYNLSTPLSGYFYGSLVNGQDSYGHWWSSTYDVNGLVRSLKVYSTDVIPNGSSGRNIGYAVRCLVGE